MNKLPKFNTYRGGDLKGTYDIYIKLDGVCVHSTDEGAFSKRGKPLYNIPSLVTGFYECFRENWDTTVSIARTQGDHKGSFRSSELYAIYPERDERLFLGTAYFPTEETIKGLLEARLLEGHEGLILWPHADCPSKKPTKVKDEITIDIRVTGVIEGTGKYKGMLGALMTGYGKVGTGFSDRDRKEMGAGEDAGFGDLTGKIIEVSFMEWTKNKMMRHPRFKRVRFDKQTENLERDN